MINLAIENFFVKLIGEDLDIKVLSGFLDSSDWKIVQLEDGYHLTSTTFLEINDHEEIKSKSTELLEILNAVAILKFYDHILVRIGDITQIDKNGSLILEASITESARLSDRQDASYNTESDLPEQPTIIELWIENAINNHPVKLVLHFFNEITWWNLYKACEVIIDDVAGTNDQDRKEIERIFLDRGIINCLEIFSVMEKD